MRHRHAGRGERRAQWPEHESEQAVIDSREVDRVATGGAGSGVLRSAGLEHRDALQVDAVDPADLDDHHH